MAVDPDGVRWIHEVKVFPGYFASITYLPHHMGGWFWSVNHTVKGLQGTGVKDAGEAALDAAEAVMAAGG